MDLSKFAFKDLYFRFQTPCECGHISLSSYHTAGTEECKYEFPVLYSDNEISFIYCPSCGIIEELEIVV